MATLTNGMENSSSFQLPDWLVEYEKTCKGTKFSNSGEGSNSDNNAQNVKKKTDEEKMKIAIEVSRQSVLRKTGGPFGCAIFQQSDDGTSSELFCLGSNLVTSANNCKYFHNCSPLRVGLSSFYYSQTHFLTHSLLYV